MLASPSLNYEGPALLHSHSESSAYRQEVPNLVDGKLVLVGDVDAHCKIDREDIAIILADVESPGHGKRQWAAIAEEHRCRFVERGTFT